MDKNLAIETLKSFVENTDNVIAKDAILALHPELAESEDERIRKALLRCCDDWEKGQFGCMAKEDIPAVRAYLEKQKEQKAVINIEHLKSYMLKYLQDASSRKDDSEIEEDTDIYARMIIKIFGNIEQKPLSTEETELNSIAFLEQMGYTCIPPGKEQKSAEYKCTNDESEYDNGYREGHRFSLKQTQEYMLPEGKTFSGLIPCWVNAPSELQPAHKYHGKNVVVMHENNGGFRCVCIDDEKPITFHLPEDTLFVEGWRKKLAGWSEEDEKKITFLERLIRYNVPEGQYGWTDGHKGGFVTKLEAISILKSLRPQPHWKPSEEQMEALKLAYEDAFECPESCVPHLPLKSLYNDLKKLKGI